jgi:hypothetical protein
MRKTTLLIIAGCCISLAACNDGSSPMLAPDSPSRETGYIGGGGRAAGQDSTTTTDSSDRTGYIGGGGRASQPDSVAP